MTTALSHEHSAKEAFVQSIDPCDLRHEWMGERYLCPQERSDDECGSSTIKLAEIHGAPTMRSHGPDHVVHTRLGGLPQ